MKGPIFLIGFLLIQTFLSAQINQISFKDFPVDGSSIRALETISRSEIWFAGSNGKYGRIHNDIIQIDSVKKLNNKVLHFRSIAYNKKNIFILSIENPAVIYKIDVKNGQFNTTAVYKEDHPKVFYDSMTFLDNKYGIAVGDPTENCLSVIRTENGGKSWGKLSCKNLPEITDGEACFAASNTNISTYKNNIWMVTGGKKARIFHSTNRGDTWKVYNTPIVQGGTMTGIFTVDFYDDQNGIIMGGNWEKKPDLNATKAITKDGGKTWNLISNGKLPGYISCVQYFPGSAKKILAVSTEGIYLSQNSGNTWEKISNRGFYTLRFSDKNTVWLAGNNVISRLTFTN
jgi:photosystem II stability/assembly factor-like uncharacterized protein